MLRYRTWASLFAGFFFVSVVGWGNVFFCLLVSIVDAYCYIHNGEIWVKGMNVSPYFYFSSIEKKFALTLTFMITIRAIKIR